MKIIVTMPIHIEIDDKLIIKEQMKKLNSLKQDLANLTFSSSAGYKKKKCRIKDIKIY